MPVKRPSERRLDGRFFLEIGANSGNTHMAIGGSFRPLEISESQAVSALPLFCRLPSCRRVNLTQQFRCELTSFYTLSKSRRNSEDVHPSHLLLIESTRRRVATTQQCQALPHPVRSTMARCYSWGLSVRKLLACRSTSCLSSVRIATSRIVKRITGSMTINVRSTRSFFTIASHRIVRS